MLLVDLKAVLDPDERVAFEGRGIAHVDIVEQLPLGEDEHA